MDLGRAKTILIITFLLLNGILLYQIYSKQQINTDYSLLMQEEITEVTQLLNSRQIYLDQPIPTDFTERAFLRVTMEERTTAEIREKLEIDSNFINIAINENYQIAYSWSNNEALQEQAYDITSGYAEFPITHLYDGRSYRPHFASIEQGQGSIVYMQHFKEYPLYGITATANVENNRIVNWQQAVLKNVEEEDTTRPILAAATALRRIPNEIENGPVRVEKIELGYYSRFTESDSWLLPPVWGITLSTGEEFYINAFTGELEGLQAN